VPTPHPNPQIRGERVYLRPLEREDLEHTVPAINDRDIAHLVGFQLPVGKAGADRFWEEEVSKKHGETGYYFAICELGSAELVGECSFHDLRPGGMRAEVGIFLLPAHVGRGLGTDAMNALVDFGFGELMLERIGLFVDPENARAIRSYEKCGFIREGVMRAFRRHRGKISDAVVMSMTRPDWDALERKRSWDYPAPKPRRKASTGSRPARSRTR
jgi:ribosomal-protein-alanine N-acetyltransferase